nr:transporter substrate-binding domain-containing protein [uncultured Pseudomonas sp.]
MSRQRSVGQSTLKLLCRLYFLFGVIALAPVQAGEVLIASGHPNYPPFSWQHGEQITGVGVELTEMIFNDLGIEVVFPVRGNWKRVQNGAASGNIDVIVGIYKTLDRTQYLAYPERSYLDDISVVWVRKGRAFTFDKWGDLIGKRGTAMLGESYGKDFDDFIVRYLQMDWVSTPLQNLKKLDNGRSDYYPFSLYGGTLQLKRYGFDDRIQPLPNAISKQGVYIAVSKKSMYIKYLDKINAAVQQFEADGTIDRLTYKYLQLAAEER